MLLDDPLDRRPLVLELGCGTSKRTPTAVGIDVLPLQGVDVVGEVLDVMRQLADASVSAIYSEHFLEHVPDAEAVVREAARVLEPGGEFRAVVPHFSNPAFYSDPTHQNYFGLYTFGYWVQSTPFSRKTPQYIEPLPFSLVAATHRFKSSRPFYVRHAIKKVLASWVNLSGWTQEFYEEHLCWLMPCYELDYVLRRT
jgi:ubiquinone/menaquinone biosynthesis C-methylase UbiE